MNGTHPGPAWPSLEEVLQGSHDLPRWLGWRLRLLVGTVLLGCLMVFGVAQWLTGLPKLPVSLRATPQGQVKLHSVDYPTLQRLEGQGVEGLRFELPQAQGPARTFDIPIDVLLLQRSGRWISDPLERQRFVAHHARMDQVLASWSPSGMTAQLRLSQAPPEPILIAPRGWMGLTPLFWLLSVMALMVLAVGAVVLLAGPQWRNVAFALLTLSQSGQLMFIAIETNLDVFAPGWFVALDTPLRMVFDLVCAAAMVQVAVLHPRRLKAWPGYTALGWLAAAALWFGLWPLRTGASWWALHLGCMALMLAAIALMSAAHQADPHPFTLVLRRFTLITLVTWVLLSLAVAKGVTRPDMQLNITIFGVMTWHVFVATQLLLSPYLSRSKQILQEFSLLAASSTIAASLDLLFVAVFSLGQFTSMTLSLFLAFGAYLIVRRWLMTRLPGRDSLTMERLFQRLYRIAREVERHPDTLDASLMRLMRELFDPLEVTLVQGHVPTTALRGNGSVLLVPLPRAAHDHGTLRHVLVLRHSHKGQRLFTTADASLAERIVEQLQRALSFDQAVEQGRSEERLRIAQDLHDDIGARLLTLMYQAPNGEIEEYIRHTIQDLKTLTRGLAAQSHGLAEAAGEWKRDLSHRLGAARCELDWKLQLDADMTLSMVQWSALTRILRELVSNAISHAKANKVQVTLRLAQDQLSLVVQDNGVGRAPASWSHGLGLGGVRKRVKQLNGSVRWLEAEPKGIRCEVVVEGFSGAHAATGSSDPTTGPMPLN